MDTPNDECKLGSKLNNETNGEPQKALKDDNIFDVTIPLQRKWLKASPHPTGENETRKGTFNVICYNILADCHTPDHFFPYCPKQYRKDVQRFPQLVREIDHHLAEIMCLQEVGQEFYKDHLEPALRKKGYRGSYAEDAKKPGPVGVATFFKESCFELIEEQKNNFSDFFPEEDHGLDVKEVETWLLGLHKAFLFSRLRCRQSNKTLCLGNTHLSFLDYERLDVIALEAVLAIRHLIRLAGGADNPHILCGDFNQEPHMPGYHALHNGFLSDQEKACLRMYPVDGEKTEQKEKYLIDLLPELFTHESKHLKSAYESVTGQEVPFSNHEDMNGTMKFPSYDNIVDDQIESEFPSGLPELDDPPEKKERLRKTYRTKPKNYGKEVFIAALDYFWYGSDRLHCTGVLEMTDESKIEQFHSAPNIIFPSDHLLMKAEFQFVS